VVKPLANQPTCSEKHSRLIAFSLYAYHQKSGGSLYLCLFNVPYDMDNLLGLKELRSAVDGVTR
jgi:hypothetical protein